MTNPAHVLAALRHQLEPDLGKRHCVALGHAAADLALQGGLCSGALHEVFAGEAGHEAPAIGFAAALAARAARKKPLLWIRQDFAALEFGELSAQGALELGLDPAQIFLIKAADATDALKAAHEALSCASLGAVVAEIPGAPKVLDLTASRRLTLSAASHAVTAIMLRPSAKPDPSAAETRWLVRAAPSRLHDDDWGRAIFDAELSRNRHGTTGRWIMEWSADDDVFKSLGREADSGAVVSAPFHRSYQENQVLRSA